MSNKKTVDRRQQTVESMKNSREQTTCSRQGKTKGTLSTVYSLLSTWKREAGFTLVELMITMVVFVFFIAAASQVFTGLLTQFKQQSKMAETNIEGIVGLDILRQDIEHAGYGLPWNVRGVTDWASVPNYNEAVSATSTPNPANFNDGNPASALPTPANTNRAPRAILSGNNSGVNGSDYLVLKAINVSTNFAAGKWQPIRAGNDSTMKTWWSEVNEYVCRNDKGDHYPDTRVIVISPGATAANSRSLIVSGGSFFTGADNYSVLTNFAAFAGDPDVRIMYGVDPDTNLRMPFNRADYFISNTNVPLRCAPNTGVLEKVVVNQSDGRLTNFLPLLDCVADMQVVVRRDTDGDGTIDTTTDDISTLNAQQIREQVKEVRVYILAHEGQKDTNYTYPTSTITIPASPDPAAGVGSTFNLSTRIGTSWQNYRWKLYTIIVRSNNLK